MSCDVKWLAHCSLTRMLLTHRDSRALCTVWTATMAELWGQPIKLAREETRLALDHIDGIQLDIAAQTYTIEPRNFSCTSTNMNYRITIDQMTAPCATSLNHAYAHHKSPFRQSFMTVLCANNMNHAYSSLVAIPTNLPVQAYTPLDQAYLHGIIPNLHTSIPSLHTSIPSLYTSKPSLHNTSPSLNQA